MQVLLFSIVMAGVETIFSNLRKVEPAQAGEIVNAQRDREEGAGIRHAHTVTKSLDQKPIAI
jgi:glycyl-tRNA synthetase alpha subunit